MAWLLREGEVLASLEVARSRRGRAKGLLGRDGIEGALLLPATRSVHTFGMRFPIDVALCEDEGDLVVVRVVRMARWRMSRPSLRARTVIEAEAGAFARWNLRPGDRLEVKE
jgi:uncharacterized protein